MDAVDQVVDVAEAPGLRTLAKDGDRLTRQRLRDKGGHGAPVDAGACAAHRC